MSVSRHPQKLTPQFICSVELGKGRTSTFHATAVAILANAVHGAVFALSSLFISTLSIFG